MIVLPQDDVSNIQITCSMDLVIKELKVHNHEYICIVLIMHLMLIWYTLKP